ncbi:MAG: glutamate--tRNA ligase [Anaerolineae bacterium]
MTINTMTAEERQALADLLFPNVTKTPAEIEAQYPARDLPESAWVSRFAPSPTGFIHIGGIFTALINRMLTSASGGAYILRIEDTDQNREIERGVEQIIEALARVDLLPDEGPISSDPVKQRGAYGPYIQSDRFDIYQVYIKDMIANGTAYPCFMTNDELSAIREQQQRENNRPGIYGVWARSRQLSLSDVERKLANGEEFVVRIKAQVRPDAKISVRDKVRERLDLPANELDSVLLKSDRFPTYHFAHVIDDYLMGVNIVLRGDEWIPSLPLHIQVLESIGAPIPMYAHFAPIAKMDGDSRRKLSKRKDDEAAMTYYYERGYPQDAILEYLLNLANSNFEDWRADNPDAPYSEFPFDIDRMGRASSLFDMEKLTSVAREIIARYDAQTVYQQALAWAETYQPEMAERLSVDAEYSVRVFDIERGGDKPRKDLAKWDEIETYYGVLFDDLFAQYVPDGYADAPEIKPADMVILLDYLIETVPQTVNEDKNEWIQRMRSYALDNGYAKRRKDYEKDPDAYKGWFGDMMMAFRVALTGKTQTPDLYEMVRTMGEERVTARFQQARTYFAEL